MVNKPVLANIKRFTIAMWRSLSCPRVHVRATLSKRNSPKKQPLGRRIFAQQELQRLVSGTGGFSHGRTPQSVPIVGLQMRLAQITPAKPDHDKRMFECRVRSLAHG